jgi:hypothetical protein
LHPITLCNFAFPPYIKGMKHIFVLAVMAALYAAPIMASPMQPTPPSAVDLDALKYVSRVLVVFAPAPEDPNFLRQMTLLAEDRGELAERDFVLVVDTDPAAMSALRTKLRPSGFALLVVDKDGKTALRKPRPWTLREIVRAIDKLPSRQGEILEALPAGR